MVDRGEVFGAVPNYGADIIGKQPNTIPGTSLQSLFFEFTHNLVNKKLILCKANIILGLRNIILLKIPSPKGMQIFLQKQEFLLFKIFFFVISIGFEVIYKNNITITIMNYMYLIAEF